MVEANIYKMAYYLSVSFDDYCHSVWNEASNENNCLPFLDPFIMIYLIGKASLKDLEKEYAKTSRPCRQFVWKQASLPIEAIKST